MKIIKKNSKYVILNQRDNGKVYMGYRYKGHQFIQEGGAISVYTWTQLFFSKGCERLKPPYDKDHYRTDLKYILNRIKTCCKEGENGKVFLSRVGSKNCPIILTDFLWEYGGTEAYAYKLKVDTDFL